MFKRNENGACVYKCTRIMRCSQDTKYICVDAKNVKGPLELYRIIQDQLVKE